MMEIFKLNQIPENMYDVVGGKAKGLCELHNAGLDIAEGFVVTNIKTNDDIEQICNYYESNGYELVAVRSSANSEDGVDFSGAGQYETYLNISGKESLKEAIKKCLQSLTNETAESYSKQFIDAKSSQMSIVIQKMVDAKIAGVCFTVNPINKKNEIIIEAVAGLGEDLVSGMAKSSTYLVDEVDIKKDSDLLSDEEVKDIVNRVKIAKEYFKNELDLEWAISVHDKLVFLQARPITTLDDATLDEFDSKTITDEMVVTTCNIGEMLPGAVTPLSISTTVVSLENGLHLMLIKAGAYKKLSELPRGSSVVTFSNHLFFNLTTIYKMATSIAGADKASVEGSICGKYLDTPPLPWPKMGKIRRGLNGMKYFKFLFGRKKAMKKIVKLEKKINLKSDEDSMGHYQLISSNLDKLDISAQLHYNTSAHSGAMSSALLMMLLPDYNNNPEEAKGAIAGLLENIDNIESVDILRSMRRIAKNVLNKNKYASKLTIKELEELITTDQGEINSAYEYFINRHGHRAIREAELRSKSWKNDHINLMENIMTVIKSGAIEPVKKEYSFVAEVEKLTKGKKYAFRKGISFVAKQSRAGVYSREFTKSYFVKIVDHYKDAYEKLGHKLVIENKLPEVDLIYFLTHEEIGNLIINGETKLVKKAMQRRRLLDEQQEIRYSDVFLGKPNPIIYEAVDVANGTVLVGVSISRGEVKGIARVIKSVEDAKLLKEGEIMVAAFTDIGWSPYYSVIKGLVTEVGSALSHGAVVAREYGLPLVVNVNNATNIIKTGDLIQLSGSKGQVTILENNK